MARSVRYFLCFPLWEDECFLNVNLIDRGYREVLSALDYHQVAPVVYLWLQLTVVKWFGFSEWSLRFVAFAAAVSSLFLFVHLSRRLLQGTARVLAVAVFAVAYPCIRYAAEAKPYGVDLLIGLVLLTLFVHWMQSGRARWLWIMAAVTPVAVGVCYPSVFIGGGICICTWLEMIRTRRRGAWPACIVFSFVLVGSFVGWVLFASASHASAELTWMNRAWSATFPPLTQPAALIGWFIKTHTGNLLAFPFGGERGASILTAAACAVGVGVLHRRKERTLLLLCLAPFVLHLIAAAMHRYPYGGHVKFSMHLAAIICLLAGLGLAAICRTRVSAITLAALLSLVAFGSIARDLANPYKAPSDHEMREFSRTFWPQLASTGRVACLKTDLGTTFSPRTYSELSWSAQFLCYQHMYRPPDVHTDRATLHVVQYHDDRFEYDHDALNRWLASMQQDHVLVDRRTHILPRYDKRRRRLITQQTVDVFTFQTRAAPQ